MITAAGSLAIRLQSVTTVAPRVKQFTFVSADRTALPAFSGGSHIVVSVQTGPISFRNAYSLIGGPDRTASYQIAVELASQSRGGSRFLHGLESADAEITSTFPSNTFPLNHTARHHVFVAGGVGITPFLTFIEDANVARASWELHYAVRSRQTAPFANNLLREYPDKVRIYASDEQNRLDLDATLRDQKLGTHLYVCGPDRLITGASEAAAALGWPARSIHYEYFQAAPAVGAFTVELARSGGAINIDSGVCLLEGLEAAGIDVPYGCRAGVCGACETAVLAGVPDHHDHYLSDEAKAAGKLIMPCVSRACSEKLVLDL